MDSGFRIPKYVSNIVFTPTAKKRYFKTGTRCFCRTQAIRFSCKYFRRWTVYENGIQIDLTTNRIEHLIFTPAWNYVLSKRRNSGDDFYRYTAQNSLQKKKPISFRLKKFWRRRICRLRSTFVCHGFNVILLVSCTFKGRFLFYIYMRTSVPWFPRYKIRLKKKNF